MHGLFVNDVVYTVVYGLVHDIVFDVVAFCKRLRCGIVGWLMAVVRTFVCIRLQPQRRKRSPKQRRS